MTPTPEREEALRMADALIARDAETPEWRRRIEVGRGGLLLLAREARALAADLEAAEQRLGELDEQRVAAVHALEATERERDDLESTIRNMDRAESKAERELTDVETDRRYQQDRARAAERDLAIAREALEAICEIGETRDVEVARATLRSLDGEPTTQAAPAERREAMSTNKGMESSLSSSLHSSSSLPTRRPRTP